MRIKQNTFLMFGMLLAMAIVASAQEADDQRKPIPITIYYRADSWIMAPPVVEDPASDDSGLTQSIFLSIIRTINPETDEPYDASEPLLDFRLEDLRHFFRLEKKEFLLGEPILVEHRIELNGPGQWTWFVGGNYRTRGRDDNFTFVLRREDSKIVPDIYPAITGVVMGGGLGSDHSISKDKPLSYWLSLQRYSGITEPGTYDLYCMTGNKQVILGETAAMRAALPDEVARDHYIDDAGALIDAGTKKPSTRYRLALDREYRDPRKPWPLKDAIPKDVLGYGSGQSFRLPLSESVNFGIVTHLRIKIRRGTPADQEEMAARWTKTAEAVSRTQPMGNYKGALLESIWFARQDDFLPLLARWISERKETARFDDSPIYLEGLAMRSDSAAFALLLKAPLAKVTNSFFYLHPARIPEAVPLCLDWLTHPDDQVRAQAESLLIRWTGQSFEHTWNGYHYQRPTLVEGKSMQKLWRAWWNETKATFKPCSSPCEKAKTIR